MSTGETFESVGKFEQKYMPDSILEFLERDLSSKLGMIQSHQHRLSRRENNPRTGSIEVAIPNGYGKTSRVEQIVKGFYSERDYEIVNEGRCAKGVIFVRKGKESYWINVMERDGFYLISIVEHIILKGFS